MGVVNFRKKCPRLGARSGVLMTTPESDDTTNVTRPSLLLRLRNPRDSEAWRTFVETTRRSWANWFSTMRRGWPRTSFAWPAPSPISKAATRSSSSTSPRPSATGRCTGARGFGLIELSRRFGGHHAHFRGMTYGVLASGKLWKGALDYLQSHPFCKKETLGS